MYLDNRQLLLLIAPFFVSLFIYFFDAEIVGNVRYVFPIYEEYSNKTLSEKTDTYLLIETKYKLYQDIKEKLELRKTNAPWIAENIFYQEEGLLEQIPQQTFAPQEELPKQITPKPYVYKLEVVYPNKKIAIINGLIVKEGGIIHDVKILKIEHNRVMLEDTKGVKWLSLFQ